jgi:ATP-dependent helicase/nuclease subunit A
MYPLSEQQQKALDLKRNIAVIAGAGSGKTTILVNRYLHILLDNPQLSVKHILAITFTEKATAEMKERIFQLIENRFQHNRSQQNRLFEILNQLQDAQIFTIHAFCSHVIRQYPVESEIGSDFTILTDIQIEEMLNRSFREFLLSPKLVTDPEKDSIKRALREFPITIVREMFKNFYRNRTIIYPFILAGNQLTPEEFATQWQHIYYQYHKQIIDNIIHQPDIWAELKILTEANLSADSNGIPLQTELSEILNDFNSLADDSEELVPLVLKLVNLLTKKDGGAYTSIPGGKSTWGKENLLIFQKLSIYFAQYTSRVFSYLPSVESVYSSVFYGINLLMERLLTEMEKTKLSLNALDFDDLQITLLQILQKFPEIRDQLKKQYAFILIDEFQDTDPLQSNIIHLLTHNHFGKLDTNRMFIVGDPKQSIYGFRNADVSLFKSYMAEVLEQGSEGIKISPLGQTIPSTINEQQGIIELNQNFRSQPGLINYFNITLGPILSEESEFDVEFKELNAELKSKDSSSLPVKLDLHIVQEDSQINPVEQQVVQIANLISHVVSEPTYQKLIQSEETYRTKPIKFGDIAILFRYRTHIQKFEQILRENGIPYLTYKGRGFYQKQEIMDLYYILRSIAYQEDNFALLNALRCDYIGLSDSFLFYLSQVKAENYWEKLKIFNEYLSRSHPENRIFNQKFAHFLNHKNMTAAVSQNEKLVIKNFIDLYQHWKTFAISGEFSRLLDEIIQKFNIKYLMQHQRDSQQKLANLDKLIHYVYDFEQSLNTPFSVNLLDALQKQIYEEVQEGEAAIFAEEENKVKLLTIHSAKGMEFPVVFLPLLERSFLYNSNVYIDKKYGYSFKLERSQQEESGKSFAYQFLSLRDRQKITAEEKRLFYVANTRARDYLFLSGSVSVKRKLPNHSYLKWLLDSHQILEEDIARDQIEQGTLAQAGIEVQTHVAVPSQKPTSNLIKKTKAEFEPSHLSEKDLAHAGSIQQKPALQLFTVTQLMIFLEDKNRYIRHYYLNDGELKNVDYPEEYVDEKGGAEWGSIVHKLLENSHIRDAAGDQAKIAQLVALQNDRIPVNTVEERLQKILAAVRQTEFYINLQKHNTFSEYSVELRIGNYLLKGIFDLLIKNNQGMWEIIDFKTNRIKASETANLTKKYDFQRRAYALLLSSIFPEQTIFPVSLLYLEPMIKDTYEFNKLEIQQIKLDTQKLMGDIFHYESSIFHPQDLFNP